MNRFAITTPADSQRVSLAPAFISESEPAGLKIVPLRQGEQLVVRLLPWYADTRRCWAALREHRWPHYEHCGYSIKAVCPKHTASELLRFSVDDNEAIVECPACEGDVPVESSLVIYASVPDKRGAILLRFWPNWINRLEELMRAGCFDLEQGRRVMLRNAQGQLEFELLEHTPLDRENFEAAMEAETVSAVGRRVNKKTLEDMAEAHAGWRAAGEPVPQIGQHLDLLKQLPHCRFVRIPWGFKGPHDFGWQATPYALMHKPNYCLNLDVGNLGLVCGWDWSAVQAGLVPAIVVIGLDADTAALAAALLECNPWLDTTFAVDSARGRKWFFGVSGPGAERCLTSCKIKSFNPQTREVEEVGDWLSGGKQGVALGLHPSGIFYRPNEKPLVTIKPEDFILPPGYTMSNDEKDTNPAGYSGYIKTRATGDEHRPVSAKQVARLLEHIPPTDERGTWFAVVCALKAWGIESGNERVAYRMAEEWSRQSRKFDKNDQKKTWESLKRGPGDRVNTVGTLYHLATQNGYGHDDE